LKFIFYGGKGGVGKTTCAAAFALALRRRVLVVSTDPAHSLGDALDVKLSSTPRQVQRGLDAVELDAPRAFARWLQDHRRALGDILEHGTWLDGTDVDALLDLSFPGVDELVGLMEISRLARAKPYDVIIVDTAPTGHTLRLLAAPETVGVVAGVLDALQAEHRLIRDRLARVARGPEAADRLIALLASQAGDTAERLRDRRQTSFYWVTLPEMMSVDESLDAMAALERAGIRVNEIVVNRVLPLARRCPLCDRRRAEQHRVLAVIRRRLGRRRKVRVIPAEVKEPRGLPALARIGRTLVTTLSTTEDAGDAEVKPSKDVSSVSPVSSVVESVGRKAAPEFLAAIRGASLIFFGGKGGVGKSTVAAATALRLARASPGRRVLLLSTDPAHSLADVLAAPVSDAPAAVRNGPKNLLVREIDAPRALAARRGDLEAALNEIASAFGTGEASSGADRAAELMNLAPPGIDELFGIISVVGARADYDVIVVDTAPTGHALRLLEMPDAAREWTQALLRVLLKYKKLVRPGQLAEELLVLAKSIRELQAMLRDAAHTRFIVVTRAAEVPRLETERLLQRLRRLQLSTPAVVVNALTHAPGACVRCRAVAAAERRSLAALRRTLRRSRRRSGECVIIQTPLAAPPPTGVAALESWARQWWMLEP
jgi:arsenite/tail-anchored protein-transporting ATPase